MYIRRFGPRARSHVHGDIRRSFVVNFCFRYQKKKHVSYMTYPALIGVRPSFLKKTAILCSASFKNVEFIRKPSLNMEKLICYDQFHINNPLAEVMGFTEFHTSISKFFEGCDLNHN